MTTYIILAILVVIAGISRQLSDMSQEGKLNHLGNWWDMDAWQNKYTIESLVRYFTNGQDRRLLDPRFFLSDTALVFLTDAKHFFAWLATGMYQASITQLLNSLYGYTWYEWIAVFLLLKGLAGISGEGIRKVIK